MIRVEGEILTKSKSKIGKNNIVTAVGERERERVAKKGNKKLLVNRKMADGDGRVCCCCTDLSIIHVSLKDVFADFLCWSVAGC